MDEYLDAAGRHSATPVLSPELAWQTYADRVRKFSVQYRKQVDDHVTATISEWRTRVGPLAENDWLSFAMKLFDIRTHQTATHNHTQRHWIDLDLVRFLELLDVDGVLAWNATVIERFDQER